ncbi:MAG: hypothetical protein UT55_C0030G0002 [Candidatus Peregrinibacteria bacterium GW2011_GWE2_39_6]|nr:MAG: hypothetical protein UT55_C0030G0002 [Candidatus Peregrinibacteria bacterium GW2011_GWE2_39_6]
MPPQTTQLEWDPAVPAYFRELVRDLEKGTPPQIAPALITPLRQFLEAISMAGLQQDRSPYQSPALSPALQAQLTRLQATRLIPEGEETNVPERLADQYLSPSEKSLLWHYQIKPIVDWILAQNDRLLRGPLPCDLHPTTINESSFLDPSMDGELESKEGSAEISAIIIPQHSAAYRRLIFSIFNTTEILWKSEPNTFNKPPERQLLPESRHRYFSNLEIGKATPIATETLGWGIDEQSFRWEENDQSGIEVEFFENQFGVPYVIATSHKSTPDASPDLAASFPFSIEIGQLKKPFQIKAPRKKSTTSALLPDCVSATLKALQGSKLNTSGKAKTIEAYIRENLEYSTEKKYNEIYKADKTTYYLKLWEHKKADCDVANNFAAELLRQLGITAYMVMGIQSREEKNYSILQESHSHAYLIVYLPESREWIKIDATPPENKPPTASDTPDLTQKDFDKNSSPNTQRSTEEAAKKFSQEAHCSLEEARKILELISNLRNLQNNEGVTVYKEAIDLWQSLTRDQQKIQKRRHGPVPLKGHSHLHYPARLFLARLFGNPHPRVAKKRNHQIETTAPLFSGLDVILLLDLSESMNFVDPSTDQSLKELQCASAFLITDAMMSAAEITKRSLPNDQKTKAVRTTILTIHDNTLKILLQPSSDWNPAQQIALYRGANQSPNGRTPLYLGFQEINQMIKQSPPERTCLVLCFTDGAPSYFQHTQQLIANLKAAGIIIFGFGITQGATAVKELFGPEHSELITDLKQLATRPLTVAFSAIKAQYKP